MITQPKSVSYLQHSLLSSILSRCHYYNVYSTEFPKSFSMLSIVYAVILTSYSAHNFLLNNWQVKKVRSEK